MSGKLLGAVQFELRTRSEMNLREHWRVSAKRKKLHRMAAKAHCSASIETPEFPIVVTLTRIAPRALDDDNLRSAFKALRDGVADWLGTDDRHKGIRWEYAQEKGAPKTYSVRIEVASLDVEKEVA